MKASLLLKTGIIAFLFCCFSLTALAQKTKSELISEQDKKELISIFEDVDPSLYRLEFNNGEEVYGKMQLKMEDLEVINKSRSPESAGVKWTFLVGDRSENEVYYIYTEGESEIVSKLGKAKATKLMALAAKYIDAGG